MYGVVCGVHQTGKGREKPQGDTLLYFFASIYSSCQRCKNTRRAVISNFRNKHWLQVNEAVVRFNLVNARCYATFRGLHSICENKAKP